MSLRKLMEIPYYNKALITELIPNYELVNLVLNHVFFLIKSLGLVIRLTIIFHGIFLIPSLLAGWNHQKCQLMIVNFWPSKTAIDCHFLPISSHQ